MKFKIFFVSALAFSLFLVYVFGFRPDSAQLRSSLVNTISGSRAEAATMSQKTATASDLAQASLTPVNFDSANSVGRIGSESDVLRVSLLKAVRADNTELTKKLIKLGADVNGRISPNGWTPLHYAVRNGNAEIVQILLKAGADPNCVGALEEQKGSGASVKPLVLAEAALDLVTQVPQTDIEQTLRQSGLGDPVLVKSMTDPNATDRYQKVINVLSNAHKNS